MHYPRWGISSRASFPGAEVGLAPTPERHPFVSISWLTLLFYLQSLKNLDVKEFYPTHRYLPAANLSMHLLLVFSHSIWSLAPFFLRYHQAMLISSWSPVSCLLILYLLFHANYYPKCFHILILLSMRLCPSVCSCYILDVTVHGIGTLLSEHRRQLWSSSSCPIYFWWSSHSFPPFLGRKHIESSLTG